MPLVLARLPDDGGRVYADVRPARPALVLGQIAVEGVGEALGQVVADATARLVIHVGADAAGDGQELAAAAAGPLDRHQLRAAHLDVRMGPAETLEDAAFRDRKRVRSVLERDVPQAQRDGFSIVGCRRRRRREAEKGQDDGRHDAGRHSWRSPFRRRRERRRRTGH